MFSRERRGPKCQDTPLYRLLFAGGGLVGNVAEASAASLGLNMLGRVWRDRSDVQPRGESGGLGTYRRPDDGVVLDTIG